MTLRIRGAQEVLWRILDQLAAAEVNKDELIDVLVQHACTVGSEGVLMVLLQDRFNNELSVARKE